MPAVISTRKSRSPPSTVASALVEPTPAEFGGGEASTFCKLSNSSIVRPMAPSASAAVMVIVCTSPPAAVCMPAGKSTFTKYLPAPTPSKPVLAQSCCWSTRCRGHIVAAPLLNTPSPPSRYSRTCAPCTSTSLAALPSFCASSRIVPTISAMSAASICRGSSDSKPSIDALRRCLTIGRAALVGIKLRNNACGSMPNAMGTLREGSGDGHAG